MQDEAVLDPQDDADVSLEDQLANDGSVDTGAAEEPTEVETEVEDTVEEPENEADSSTAEEEDLEEKTDPPDTDPEYGEKVKQRIDKLTESFRVSERTNEEKDQEIEELRKQLDAIPEEAEPFKTLEDFEYDQGKWNAYLGAEISKRATEAAREVTKDYQTQTNTESRQDEFRKRETEFAKTVKDYHEKVYGDKDGQRLWKASDAMAREIQFSDMGEQIAYHLANNPDVAAEIFNLSERETVRRITRLEDTLIAEKAKADKTKVTKAPPPPPKIKAGDAGLSRGFHEGMSDSDFDKLRRKQIANR